MRKMLQSVFLVLALLGLGLSLVIAGCGNGADVASTSDPANENPPPSETADVETSAVSEDVPAADAPEVDVTVEPPPENAATPESSAPEETDPVTSEEAPSEDPLAEAAAVNDTDPQAPGEVEPSLAEAVDQPTVSSSEVTLLTWARDAGGMNHCDRLSIFGDGKVEAVVCKGFASEPQIDGSLTEEQLERVMAWVAEYTPFTRREMEISRAVRTTMLDGTGEVVPSKEEKVEIAAFAADIFFEITSSD